MMSAAPVMILASSRCRRRSPAGHRVALPDLRKQEDLVVHREAEEDGEEEERHPGLDRLHLLKAEQARCAAVLEDGDDEPVGGADGEEVEDDRRRRDDDGAKSEREQDHAQAEHEGEDDREPAAHDVEVVEVLGRRPGDEGAGVDPGERVRDVVGAKPLDRLDRAVAQGVRRNRHSQQREVAAGTRL